MNILCDFILCCCILICFCTVQVVRIEYKQWIKDKQMKLLSQEKSLESIRDTAAARDVASRARALLTLPPPPPRSENRDSMTQAQAQVLGQGGQGQGQGQGDWSVQSAHNNSNSDSSIVSSSSATSSSAHNTVHASPVSTTHDAGAGNRPLLGVESESTGCTGTTVSEDVSMVETVISAAASAPLSSAVSITEGDRTEVIQGDSGRSLSPSVNTLDRHDVQEQDLDFQSLVMTPSTTQHSTVISESQESALVPSMGTSQSSSSQELKNNFEEYDEAGDEYLTSLNYTFVSFISYPFVLSSSSKAGVLECDATQQMRRGEYFMTLSAGIYCTILLVSLLLLVFMSFLLCSFLLISSSPSLSNLSCKL